MSIESYGGDPDIVATREEISRVAFEIKLCAETLAAWDPMQTLWLDPVQQIQFRVLSVSIHQKLEKLYSHCHIAAESYFTTEAQIQRRFSLTLIPELANIASGIGSALGWKLDTKVQAIKSLETTAHKPETITSMLDRLWRLSSKPEPTIGIDLFEQTAGKKLAVVFIPGTQTLGLGGGENPLDMQSNILAMGGANRAASEKAVLLAIKQAGIKSGDELILVGHSQGGMVAGNLAAFPTGFIAAGLVTFGAPIAQLSKLRTPVLAIEHVNDPVPNLSGKANPMKNNWVSVQRVSHKVESDAVLFSHSLKSYRQTTTEVDGSNETGIKNIRSKIIQKLKGTKPLKSLEFVISRESQ